MNLIIQFNKQTSLMVSLLYWSIVDSGENCFILFADPEIVENSVLGEAERARCFNINDFNYSCLREFEHLEIVTQTDVWNLQVSKNVVDLILRDDPSRVCALSFYSDGVMNAFFNIGIISNINSDLYSDYCKIKCFYFFGQVHDFYSELAPFDRRCVSYQSVNRISIDCISDIEIDSSKGRDIIVVPLRMWGDNSFHGGRYSFKNGYLDTAYVISELINSFYGKINKNIPVLLRPDLRDLEFSQKVINELSTSFEIEFIEDCFPKFVFLEQILVYLKKSSFKVGLINFDSSAAVYACAGNLADSILIGCDLTLIKDVAPNDTVYTYIQENINIYSNMIPDLFPANDFKMINNGLYYCSMR